MSLFGISNLCPIVMGFGSRACPCRHGRPFGPGPASYRKDSRRLRHLRLVKISSSSSSRLAGFLLPFSNEERNGSQREDSCFRVVIPEVHLIECKPRVVSACISFTAIVTIIIARLLGTRRSVVPRQHVLLCRLRENILFSSVFETRFAAAAIAIARRCTETCNTKSVTNSIPRAGKKSIKQQQQSKDKQTKEHQRLIHLRTWQAPLPGGGLKPASSPREDDEYGLLVVHENGGLERPAVELRVCDASGHLRR
ncbi:putative secreted protein [Anopheles sinensis]|uniref:Putative secreted protein n=1 Tax=Anopheles sinensis TaxID=74873 RepID=A0A084VXV2_ANOSI|nr:putative secreted protein [Anopheles sinensis]